MHKALILALLLGLSLAPTAVVHAQDDLEFDARDPHRNPRAALFAAPGFPAVDAPAISADVLDAALADLPVDRLTSVDELKSKLRLAAYDLLVLPHGSAFPLEAWTEIRFFVKRGGGLVVLGGAPFHQPVLQEDGEFVLGTRQPTFAHEFLIGPVDLWEPDPQQTYRIAPVEEHGWKSKSPMPDRVWIPIVRLAEKADLPGKDGSEGHRDGVQRPLVHLLDENDLPRAAPFFEIDRLRGESAGARWVFAPIDAALDATTIRALILRAFEGASELDAGPVHASLEAGETATIRIARRRPFVRAEEVVPEVAEITALDPSGEIVFRGEARLAGTPEARHGEIRITTKQPLGPGLHRVEVALPDMPIPNRLTTGFWVRDEALLASAEPLSVSRDWLRRGDEVFPINGVTYMASDVHRKFLLEPNPAVWDRDFALMKRLGVNFIRTGTWTGHDRVMLNSGAIDEGFLRSLDAYVQGAAEHGIYVNYTFFAFQPPGHGDANVYLGPRALEGQRELLTMTARRFRDVHWVHWDLINEPSYAPSDRLWTNQPVGDPHEERAWKEWVRDRHGDDTAALRDRWQDPTRWILTLPGAEELSRHYLREHRRPRKARDFGVFSNEVVAEWARTLREVLRTAGGDVLVTLGQDEGGTYTRPSQQIHGEFVDYTALHPWWRNDDLFASGTMAKIPEKPMLFQETGLMRLEDLDGWSWRTPEHAARVLERKYSAALAARGAGVINWAWDINPYQPIDNESVIGFRRPDGTFKPEVDVVSKWTRFFETATPRLDDFEPDEVIVVIPHSRLLMGRPGGADGYKRVVKMLAERWGVGATGLSELRLTAERLQHAKLIVVPSPLVLEDSAAEALLEASQNGAEILVTGVVLGNPYGEIPEALETLGIASEGEPVRLREESAHGTATFDRDLREQMFRAVAAPRKADRETIRHELLPLEFAREDEPLAALLGDALQGAGVAAQPSRSGIAARLLYAPEVVLAVLINENANAGVRELTIAGSRLEIPVAAERSRWILFDRAE